MTMDTPEMHKATYDLALKLSKVCDGENAAVVLAAMASLAGQSVFNIAAPNNIAPLKVIEAFMDDVKEWTGKYIAFHIEENILAPAEKAITNPVEH